MAGCNMFIDLSTARTNYNKTRAEFFAHKADAVPALAMISHRESTEQLATARLKEAKGGEGAAHSATHDGPSEAQLLEALQPLYAEAEFLLRTPLSSADALQLAAERGAALDHTPRQ